jgi:hypothetical protein
VEQIYKEQETKNSCANVSFNKLALPRLLPSYKTYTMYNMDNWTHFFLTIANTADSWVASIDNFFQILTLVFTVNLESLEWTVPKNKKRTKENGKM